MTLSFLALEILDNYESIDEIKRIEASNEKLQELINIYEKQIEMAKSDPDILNRLQRKTFGTETPPEDAAFPQASQELIKLARKALAETEKTIARPAKLRKYIEHSAEKKNRLGLFYSGAALILIAFICFSAPKRKQPVKQKPEAQAQG
ncbi:MAG: hypothetical protein FVQ82_07150 [Planctomycetes bacterium]|nr:hypothetical protein [Planctomycetota bacterium]